MNRNALEIKEEDVADNVASLTSAPLNEEERTTTKKLVEDTALSSHMYGWDVLNLE